jgi:hypothetical protein
MLNFQWHKNWAVRMDEWKMIGREGSENYQLYRLTDKEPERKNYAQDRKDLISTMLSIRESWLNELTLGH